MSSSTVETQTPSAVQVHVNDDTLSVDLADGRAISVPLVWFPRLSHGTSEERNKWRLIAGGRGIHWPDLDEDISVENLLAGKSSGESQASFKKWLEQRSNSAPVVVSFRKRIGASTWHFCETCSTWPSNDYDEQFIKPTSGELCKECLAKSNVGLL